jgi:hypothetical protein
MMRYFVTYIFVISYLGDVRNVIQMLACWNGSRYENISISNVVSVFDIWTTWRERNHKSFKGVKCLACHRAAIFEIFIYLDVCLR